MDQNTDNSIPNPTPEIQPAVESEVDATPKIIPVQSENEPVEPTLPTVVSPETPALSPTPSPELVPPAPEPAAPTPPAQSIDTADTTSQPAIVSSSFDPTAPTVPTVSPVDQSSMSSAKLDPPSKSKRRLLKPLIAVLVAVVAIGGGSAAAYYGYIVPNEPQNVLMTAVVNSLEQNQTTFAGTLNESSISTSAALTSLKMTMSGSNDATKKAADVALDFNVNGINLSVEARLIDQNVYIKPGDLTPLVALLSSLNAQYTKPATLVAKELSNQWIVIDKSLIDSSGASCLLDSDTTISKSDESLLQSAFLKNTFLSVTSTSSATVAGQTVKQYNAVIDNNKGANFINSIGNLSVFKSLGSCGSGKSQKLPTAKGDGKTEAVTIWVDSQNKRVVKVSYTPSDQVIAQSHTKGSLDITFGYKATPIDTPANALPAEQVLQQIQTQLNASGLGGNLLGAVSNKTHLNIAASRLQESL